MLVLRLAELLPPLLASGSWEAAEHGVLALLEVCVALEQPEARPRGALLDKRGKASQPDCADRLRDLERFARDLLTSLGFFDDEHLLLML